MPEIVKNLSFRDYAQREGLSNSALSKIAISPLHYKQSLEQPEKTTDALSFGSLLHCLVLESNKFECDFAVEPVVDKRTKAGREVIEQFYLENSDKTIVRQDQLTLANTLKEKIMQHKIAKKLLTGNGDNEVSLFWADKETGVKCKGRLDRVKNKIIIDIKTTISSKPDEFSRKAYKFNYHKQAYWYCTGYSECFGEEPAGFVFIAVEKDPPYLVTVFQATELFKEIGKIEARENLLTYKECSEKNNWWGYDGEKAKIHDLDPPEWIYKKYIENIELEEE